MKLKGVSERQRTNANGVLAEGVGFEPTIRFPVYTLSKRAPSATRPPHRRGRCGQYSHGPRPDNPTENSSVRPRATLPATPAPSGRRGAGDFATTGPSA